MYTNEHPLLERLIFKNRLLLLVIFIAVTIFMGYRAGFIKPDTRLDRLVPSGHEFVVSAQEFLDPTDANNGKIRVAVSTTGETIFDKAYLDTLQKISDELSLVAGVDTGSLKSLWTPSTMWVAITKEGLDAGPVIDFSKYNASQESMDLIKTNSLKAGIVGSYVANDFRSTMIDFSVLQENPETGLPVDFQDLSHAIEDIRAKYESDTVKIYSIGDVKKLADLVDGFALIAQFFAMAFVITAVLLFAYSRCLRSTIAPLICSVVAVTWQLGALNLLGYDLGVFSVLVPFLVFAIGVSHGVQMIGMAAHEAGHGLDKLGAARSTFRNLYKPGLLALLSDGIGFATLLLIDIGAIQDLAMAASVGIGLMIITNLILLPIILSYVGVSKACAKRAAGADNDSHTAWAAMAVFTGKKAAGLTIAVAAVLTAGGAYLAQDLKIGDLEKGAPELRADSRYNVSNNFITTSFSTSTDQMTLFVATPKGQINSYKTTDLTNRLELILYNTPGVKNISSDASAIKGGRYFTNEMNIKFYGIPRNDRLLQRYASMSGGDLMAGATDEDANQSTFVIELADHKQATLVGVVDAIKGFAAENNDDDIRFVLGYQNGAFEAATNEVIEKAQWEILIYVYAVVAIMCMLMFRSIRAVICVLLPLAVVSVFCQALMAELGIGVKVATLPVIALGVGIGVDYGIYIFSKLDSFLKAGHSLREAYIETLNTTGKAVMFTGITLAVGVATWYFSPIKFQADMGILLTFMFILNMIGALTLLPALCCFLIKPTKVDADAETVVVKQESETAAIA